MKKAFSRAVILIRCLYDWLSGTSIGKALLLLLGLSIIFRWFFYIDRFSVNLLFYDMWTFYGAFFENKDSFIELFTWQHGPHRQGIGFVLTKYIDQLSGWNTRWICFTIGFLILAASAVYLWVKKKLFGSLRYFDVIILFIFLAPTQYGLYSNTPNISHGAMPAFLLSVYCLVWLIENRVLKYTLVILLNFLLIYSGFGFFMGVITPAILLVDLWRFRKSGFVRRAALVAFFVSILSFASFFIDYTFGATANHDFKFPHDRPIEYLDYINNMMANALNGKYIPGMVALVICVYVGVVHVKCLVDPHIAAKEYQISKIIIILLAFSFLFMISTAIGRVSIGIAGARASRYVTYILPAFLAVYFHICNLNFRSYKLLAPLCLGFLLVKTTFVGSELVMMRGFRDSKQTWKEKYLETRDIQKASEGTRYGIHQSSDESWIQGRLNYLEKHRLNLFLDEEE